MFTVVIKNNQTLRIFHEDKEGKIYLSLSRLKDRWHVMLLKDNWEDLTFRLYVLEKDAMILDIKPYTNYLIDLLDKKKKDMPVKESEQIEKLKNIFEKIKCS